MGSLAVVDELLARASALPDGNGNSVKTLEISREEMLMLVNLGVGRYSENQSRANHSYVAKVEFQNLVFVNKGYTPPDPEPWRESKSERRGI